MNTEYNISEYIENRLHEQQQYHSNKSVELKKKFVMLNIIILCISAVIPVVTCFIDMFPFTVKIVITILSNSSTVITGYLALTNTHSLFIEYRVISEKLKSLEQLYKTKTPPFNNDDAFNLLVSECESILSEGNEKWYSTQKNKKVQS